MTAPLSHWSPDPNTSWAENGSDAHRTNMSSTRDNATIAAGSKITPSYSSVILMPTVYGAICLLGIAGNTTVLVTMVKKSSSRWLSVHEIFIVNLSLVDLLFLLGMPFLIHQLTGHGAWHFGETLCTLITGMDANSQFTSTYILTGMSIDRYLATVHPVSSSRFRKPALASCVVASLWLLSLASVSPIWLYAGLIPFPDGTNGCGIRLPNPERDIYWFILYQFFLAFALPFLVITLAYARILQRMSSCVVPSVQRSVRLRAKKVTRVAVAVCLVFFVCWAPYHVLQLAQLALSQPTPLFYYAYNAAISLGYANSCLNPFVYILLCTTFRQRLLLLVQPAPGTTPPEMDYGS